MTSSLARAVLVGLVLMTACGREEAPSARAKVEPLSAAEVKRGHDACRTYIERLCRCALTHTEYVEECELIRNARPDALRKAIEASETNEDDNVRWRTQVTARRIMARCIEDDNRLDIGKCPRQAPDPDPSPVESAPEPTPAPM